MLVQPLLLGLFACCSMAAAHRRKALAWPGNARWSHGGVSREATTIKETVAPWPGSAPQGPASWGRCTCGQPCLGSEGLPRLTRASEARAGRVPRASARRASQPVARKMLKLGRLETAARAEMEIRVWHWWEISVWHVWETTLRAAPAHASVASKAAVHDGSCALQGVAQIYDVLKGIVMQGLGASAACARDPPGKGRERLRAREDGHALHLQPPPPPRTHTHTVGRRRSSKRGESEKQRSAARGTWSWRPCEGCNLARLLGRAYPMGGAD
eukprot:356915-Chlamydomonas_euryale.AAC.6